MDFPKNIFEDFMKMQNKMLEDQTKLYENFMKSFDMEGSNWAANYFSNLKPLKELDFFNEYNKLSANAEMNLKEWLKRVPNMDAAMESYRENIKLLDRVYEAYVALFFQGNYREASEKVKEVYTAWNEQFIQLAKKNFETFLPKQSREIFENFQMDQFLKPFLDQSKQALDFYEEAMKQEPVIVVDKVRDFYEDMLNNADKVPMIGVSEEVKKKNKENFKTFLELQLKLLEFNLFLHRATRELGLQAQKNCLNRIEREHEMEDFADFYASWSKDLETAYSELIQSKEYQRLADEVLELVEDNRSKYYNMWEEQLKDSPIFTEAKAKKFLDHSDLKKEIKNVKDQVKAGEVSQHEVNKKIDEVKLKLDHETKELNQKFLELQQKSEKDDLELRESLGQLESRDDVAKIKKTIESFQKEQVDPTKKELEDLKKEVETLKKLDPKKELEQMEKAYEKDMKALKDEIAALKKELATDKKEKSTKKSSK